MGASTQQEKNDISVVHFVSWSERREKLYEYRNFRLFFVGAGAGEFDNGTFFNFDRCPGKFAQNASKTRYFSFK